MAENNQKLNLVGTDAQEWEPGDTGTGTELQRSFGALESQTRAEVDMQITTAKKYPRSLEKFKRDAMSMATLDEGVAEECMYGLRRSGKVIEGPSVRLAEIVQTAWGNCRSGARIIDDDGTFLTAQGVFHDLERNVYVSVEIRRRVTDKNGRRYSDDMIGVTANAACAIAFRNAVFKGIPKAYSNQIYNAARETAVGTAETLGAKRQKMVDYFKSRYGVDEAQVCAALGLKGLDDIGLDELAMLKGMATAIREGDTTIEETFPGATGKPATAGTASTIEQRGKQKAAAAKKEQAKAPEEAAKPAPENNAATQQAEAKKEEPPAAATQEAAKKEPETPFDESHQGKQPEMFETQEAPKEKYAPAKNALTEALAQKGVGEDDAVKFCKGLKFISGDEGLADMPTVRVNQIMGNIDTFVSKLNAVKAAGKI